MTAQEHRILRSALWIYVNQYSLHWELSALARTNPDGEIATYYHSFLADHGLLDVSRPQLSSRALAIYRAFPEEVGMEDLLFSGTHQLTDKEYAVISPIIEVYLDFPALHFDLVRLAKSKGQMRLAPHVKEILGGEALLDPCRMSLHSLVRRVYSYLPLDTELEELIGKAIGLR